MTRRSMLALVAGCFVANEASAQRVRLRFLPLIGGNLTDDASGAQWIDDNGVTAFTDDNGV